MMNDDHRETQEIERHLLSYLVGFQDLKDASDGLKRLLESMLDEQAIKYHLVEARAKSFESYRTKSAKRKSDGSPKYAQLPHGIQDCIAARIIVFTDTDRIRILDEIRLRFTILDGEDRNPADERTDKLKPGWGYDSHHFIISGMKDDSSIDTQPLGRFFAEQRCLELQVRTVASHAWAEYEHDVRYKPERLGSLSKERQGFVQSLFRSAAELRIIIDGIFSDIERILSSSDSSEAPERSSDGPSLDSGPARSLDPDSLQSRLSELYPDNHSSKADAVEWMLRVLDAAGVNSISDLNKVTAQADSARVAELMDYRTAVSRIRRLDDDLLSVLGDLYVERTRDVADNEAARERRQRYLPARLNRLSGKLRIYSVHDGRNSAAPLVTAATAVRLLTALVVEKHGASAAEIEGFISSNADDFSAAARANRWMFDTGDELWIHGNLSRAAAQIAMEALVSKLATDDVSVRLSGDLLFPKSVEDQRG